MQGRDCDWVVKTFQELNFLLDFESVVFEKDSVKWKFPSSFVMGHTYLLVSQYSLSCNYCPTFHEIKRTPFRLKQNIIFRLVYGDCLKVFYFGQIGVATAFIVVLFLDWCYPRWQCWNTNHLDLVGSDTKTLVHLHPIRGKPTFSINSLIGNQIAIFGPI